MTDFEGRLRAAMAASAGPAPAGLLDGVYHRHRRHVRRLVTACVAAVAVGIAGTLVTRGILAAGPGGTGPAATGPAATGMAVSPSAVPSSPAAAPGTVLRDCQSSNGGKVSADWKAHSVHAGPVWFVYARPGSTPSSGQRLRAGKTRVNAMIITVSNGRTATVTAAPRLGGRFRFLAGFNGAGTPYTLSEGEPGLTLSGCPATPGTHHIPVGYAAGQTMFWEGYVTDLRGCFPLQVRTSPASPPIRVTVAPTGGHCGA